jgi:tetratricopeptide (TPR) repeat protein
MTAGNQHKDRILYAPVKDELLSIEQYDEMININPCHAPTYLQRGFAYHQQEKYQLAIKDYEEAIRLNPDFVDAYYLRQLAREKEQSGKPHRHLNRSSRILSPV